jgi:hypothetical protein
MAGGVKNMDMLQLTLLSKISSDSKLACIAACWCVIIIVMSELKLISTVLSRLLNLETGVSLYVHIIICEIDAL